MDMEQNNWNENQQPRDPVIIVGEPERDRRQSSSLAVCSLVLGILSIVFCLFPYLSIIIGLVGLIQGIVCLAQRRAGRGMAIAGIVTGVLGVMISILLGVIMVIGMMFYVG